MRKENIVIVYYGAAKVGKMQNIQYLHEHLAVDTKSKPVRTVLDGYDRIISVELVLRNTCIRLQCLDGAVYFPQSRQTVLESADGVVFVADSLSMRLNANLRALHELYDCVIRRELTLTTFPWIIQYTGQDLPKQEILPISVLQERLNPHKLPSYEANMSTGEGVIETFQAILRRVMQDAHE